MQNSNHLHTSSINVIIGAYIEQKALIHKVHQKIDVGKECDGFFRKIGKKNRQIRYQKFDDVSDCII